MVVDTPGDQRSMAIIRPYETTVVLVDQVGVRTAIH